jgi:hypothetical protein
VTVFTPRTAERLLDGDIAEAFFQAVLKQAGERNLLSDEHFTVDGTLLEAWAIVKSFQRKDAKPAAPPDDPGNATVDFHGEKLEPDARIVLYVCVRNPRNWSPDRQRSNKELPQCTEGRAETAKPAISERKHSSGSQRVVPPYYRNLRRDLSFLRCRLPRKG